MRNIAIAMIILMGLLHWSTASAQGKQEKAVYEAKLEKGIEAFYSTDWQQARAIYADLKSMNPKDARAYFFDSMIPFWTYYFGEHSGTAAQSFMARSQKAIDVGRNQLTRNPDDTTMVLMLSGLYGYRSLISASERQYQKAVQSGVTGFKYTRQLLALDADDPKALVGKGMFYYMVGSVPHGLKWVTNMIGFSGDMEEGFDALKQAAESESYVSNDAKMILAYLYEREKQPRKALIFLQQLADKFPENIIFQYNLARLYEKCGLREKALQKYRRVLSLDVVGLQSIKDKSAGRLKSL